MLSINYNDKINELLKVNDTCIPYLGIFNIAIFLRDGASDLSGT